jgi:hypothetical protein
LSRVTFLRFLPENILFTHTGIKPNSTSGKVVTGSRDIAPEGVKAGGVALRGERQEALPVARDGLVNEEPQGSR